MTRTALLNNVDHQDLKVITGHSAKFGDNVNQVLVFPTEFGEVQREYPILFMKDAEGAYQSVALLGLDKGENLFLNENGWQARYLPAIQQRGPFMIGMQRKDVDGEAREEPMIYVDLDHPRISEKEGQPLFMPQGGNSPYLDHIAGLLRIIHLGAGISKTMFSVFEELDLIEPVAIEVNLNDREKYKLPGYFTISQERFGKLDGASLERMHKGGFLNAAYLVISSLGNVHRLINMKNRKNTDS